MSAASTARDEPSSRNAEWRRIVEERLGSLAADYRLRDAIAETRSLPTDIGVLDRLPRELQVDCMHTTAVTGSTVYSVTLLIGDRYTCHRSKDPYVEVLARILGSWFEHTTACLAASPVPGVTPDLIALTLWIDYDRSELDLSVRSPFGTVTLKDAWGRVDECAERHL